MSEPVNRLLVSVDAENEHVVSLELDDEIVAASSPYVGQWNDVVSTTNWEKGRIISEWRAALERSEAPAAQYSDEAWAQLVGDVTSQHVGRLRRVHQRFGEVHTEYAGLYWSHFQAAIEWPDAEMWLEGALQNGWSIAKMRAERWEVTGEKSEGELTPIETSTPTTQAASPRAEVSDSTEEEASADEPAPWEEGSESSEVASAKHAEVDSLAAEPREKIRPFEQLPELPTDIAEAFEQFKLAILTHKFTGWSEISRSDVLSCLEALKTLAMAPAE
jgi:hypothetical protein